MAGTIRRSRIAIGATLAVAALVGVAVVLVQLPPDEKPDTGIAGKVLGPNESPLAGGKKVSLEQATAEFSVPIYRPDLPLASDDLIRDIWMDTDKSEPLIYMRYTTGVVMKIGPPSGRASTEEWAKALTGDGVDGAIKDITNIPAFVVTPHFPSLGSVRMFLRNTYVVIIGEGKNFTTDQLRDLAISTIHRADAIEAERPSASA
jgi:hypothetical protein